MPSLKDNIQLFFRALFRRATYSNPAYRKWRLWVLGIIAAGIVLPLLFVIYVIATMPSLQGLENPSSNLSTQVYSADRKLLGTYYLNEDRINVKHSDLPQNLQDALIATEDIRFYDHSGLDPFFVLRAPFMLFTGDLRGGSTLTQQLSRNLYDAVGTQRSVFRKIKEAIVAIYLERRYTKQEILTAYLNTVPFGGTLYGIQAASKSYFGKNCQELTVHESALLVGILKGPSFYNPFKYEQRALLRRNTVLEQMHKYGYLSDADLDKNRKLPLGAVETRGNEHNAGLAPYFREHLRRWLTDWCAKKGLDVYTSGLRVYTTLNSRHQQYAEEAMREHLTDLQKEFDRQLKGHEPWKKDTSIIQRAIVQSARYNMMKTAGSTTGEISKAFRTKRSMRVFRWNQRGYVDTSMTPRDSIIYYQKFLEPGLITIDPSNGHVIAWVGGIDHQYFQYDHVRHGKRQVGSTFKPFVYTAAFDNGFSPCHEELNMPIEVESGDGTMWRPKNADGKVGGYYTLRKALALSTNIITARMIKAIGPRVVVDYAKRMGIESEIEPVHAIALGVSDLSVYELTSAYATFADKGRWHEPIFVSRIEDKFGNVIEDFKGNSREAISEETAYLMVDMLRGVVNEGTAGNLRWQYNLPEGLDLGGKTGTTQEHADGWYVGISPQFACGVWVGCSDRSVRFRYLDWGQGGKMAMPIYAKYMKKVYTDKELAVPKTFFERPKTLKVEIDCKRYRERHPRQRPEEGSGRITDFDN